MARIVSALIVASMMVLQIPARAEAVEYDGLTRTELLQIISDAEDAIKRNHSVTSKVSDKLCELTKLNIVRLMDDLQGEPQWRWVDWAYEREWTTLTVVTDARINGTLQKVNATYRDLGGDEYRLMYLQVGDEVLLNDSGVEPSVAAPVETIETAAPEIEDAPKTEMPTPDEATAPVAKRGDKSDAVKRVQQMLTRLGYLSGTADGDFGGGTEKAVMKFQSENGLPSDGVVTQDVYDKLESSAASAPEPVEVITISAKKLFDAFDENEFAAEELYKNKHMEVSGKIESIDTDILGTPYITLAVGQYSFFSVQCFFDRDSKPTLAKLKKGKSIVIRGTCKGWTGNILIDDCQIVG